MAGFVFCVECGCEALPSLGRTVGVAERDLADAPVMACTECLDSYAFCGVDGEPADWPGNAETRNARGVVLADLVEPLIASAPDGHRAVSPGAPCSVAADRVAGFLAARLDLSREEGTLGRLNLEQCRAAYRALRGVTYADVQAWAARARDKRRSAA